MKIKEVFSRKISTTACIAIICIIVGVIYATYLHYSINKEKTVSEFKYPQIITNNQLKKVSEPNILTWQNQYTNNNFGFSMYLPHALDDYTVQVSSGTVSRVSFLFRVTNQDYTKQTGQVWADVFSILAYPKTRIGELQQDCNLSSTNNYSYKCGFKGGYSIGENDTYVFYFAKGGQNMNAYPQAFDDTEYEKNKSAVTTTIKIVPALLSYDDTAQHVFTDSFNKYEISFPNDWTASPRLPSADRKNAYIGLIRGAVEEIIFDNNYVRNPLLANTIEGNIKLINSKTNIIGPNSTFKEIKIKEGVVFYSQTQNAPLERSFYIIGNHDVLNGSLHTGPKENDSNGLAQIVKILSSFKFLQ